MAQQPIKATPVGFTSSTPDSYVINAGALYYNLTWSETDGWKGIPLGATNGGSTLKIEQETREIEVDGVFTSYVGSKILQSSSMTLETNIKEITANTIKMAINGQVSKGDGTDYPEDWEIVEGKGRIEKSDYIQNIAIVGEYSGSNEPIIAILDNVLSTEGLSIEFTDDEEGVIAATFQAHADEGQVRNRKLPGRILFPPKSSKPSSELA